MGYGDFPANDGSNDSSSDGGTVCDSSDNGSGYASSNATVIQ